MTDDRYIKEKIKPVLGYFTTLNFIDRVGKKWYSGFKEQLSNILNKVYDDGFADGINEDKKDLQHYKDTTIGLWATDKPDKIPNNLKKYFWRLE